MPATIVVGGQFGSEGKGKVVALRASQANRPFLVRCGGPNSGHTVTIRGEDKIMRQVPSCAEPERATFCIAAGCVVDETILISELDMLNIERQRIFVDPRAVLVTEQDRLEECNALNYIGSTCSGTGEALLRRMSRRPEVRLAKDSEILRQRCRVETVATRLHDAIDDGADVIIEGTQGFALSLLHGPAYPFVTSRDTTAAGFAMEAGLSPRDIDAIVMVLRTFPIRVGGTSGPFPNETSWDAIAELSGAPHVLPEYTSVTKRLRRVANFDLPAVKLACKYNRPTSLAVMGLDRLDYANTNFTEMNDLTQTARAFLDALDAETGIPIAFAGTGFGTFDVVRIPLQNPHLAAANA